MKIAIWGAGKFGRFIKGQLDKRSDITLVGFIDHGMQFGGGQTEVDGLKVITFSQARMQADLILVAILDYLSVCKELQPEDKNRVAIIKGRVYTLRKELSCDILHDENLLWVKDLEKIDKPVLTHLETNIMDGCNLNCRGCSHFSNLFGIEEHVPFSSFCKDLKQIAEHTNITQLYLLGGEALLNRQLTDYIDFSRKTLPETDIQIVSNGLLIPKQEEEFFHCCRENDISISISGYAPTLMIKEKIINVLENNHVEYSFRDEVLDFGKNIDLQGLANPEIAAKTCREKACHFFRNGRIYKCPFEALGNRLFTHYGVEIRFHGGIDLYDPDLDWDELVRQLDETPVFACRYCGKEERTEWKIEHNPKLDDWII